MIDQRQEWMTVEEIAKAIGAKVSAVREALKELAVESRRDLADRRRYEYPPGTDQRVRDWLLSR